jgi:FkbM family methyltransferase
MTSLMKNAFTAVTRPSIALEYMSWLAHRSLGREPVRSVCGVRVGAFNSFSEYHSFSRGVSSAELSFLEHGAFKDGAILDIGANLGLFSLILAKRFKARRVVAFEPAPSTFAALEANVKRNGASNIECRQIAVSDRETTATFSVLEHSRATSSFTVAGGQHASASQIEIQCTTVDAFAHSAGIGQMALMKADVEGYETAVFRGSQRVLRDLRPVVYFEVCPALAERCGFRADEAAQLLEQTAYRLNRIAHDGSLQAVRAQDARGVHLENWVGLPS